MNMSESIIELSKALSKFQGEVKQPTKDGKNPHFKSNYVTIDGVVEAITETASKHGLSFMQFPVNEEDKVGVYTLVMHESGEWIKSEPIFTRLQKNDAQGVGSALTYLRRYSLSAVFGITSDVDDDGNQASYNKPQQQQQPTQQQQQPQQQPTQQQKPNTAEEAGKYVINFGKHSGKTLKELWKEQPGYIAWLSENSTSEDIKNCISLLQEAVALANAKKKMNQGD